MAGGSRRLDIVYHIETGQADQAAEGFNQRELARDKARAKSGEQSAIDRAKAEAKLQDAQDESGRKAEESLDRQKKAHKDNNTSILDGVGAALKFTGAMMGLQGAQQIISVLSDTFSKIRMDAFKATEDVMKMRGAVRELQALRGEMGQTGKGISHVFGITKDTLQKPEEAMAMESAGLGVGELALKTDRDRQQFTEAMKSAGKFAMLEGGDAGAYGQMMGQMALQSKGPIDAREMEARANRLFQIQQPGGFKNMSSAMGQYAGMNGMIQNGVYTPEEAMGLLSAFSVSSPNEAGTKSEQFTRAVMAGRIKSRGMAVSKDVDLEKTSDYFKDLGIGEQDSAIARGKKIADDLAKQKAQSEANGQKFNATEYLMLHGFGNQQDAAAIMDFAGMKNSGNLDKIEAAQNAPLDYGKTGKGVISEKFAERLKTDNFFKRRQVDVLGEAADVNQGIEEEPLALAQRAAFNRLKAQGKITGTFEEWNEIERGGLSGSTKAGVQDMFHGNYHGQVTREAMQSLESERRRLGIARPGLMQSAHGFELEMAQKVQAAGGDVTGGTAEALDKAAKNIEKATAGLEKAINPDGPPAPMQGKPNVQAARP